MIGDLLTASIQKVITFLLYVAFPVEMKNFYRWAILAYSNEVSLDDSWSANPMLKDFTSLWLTRFARWITRLIHIVYCGLPRWITRVIHGLYHFLLYSEKFVMHLEAFIMPLVMLTVVLLCFFFFFFFFFIYTQTKVREWSRATLKVTQLVWCECRRHMEKKIVCYFFLICSVLISIDVILVTVTLHIMRKVMKVIQAVNIHHLRENYMKVIMKPWSLWWDGNV